MEYRKIKLFLTHSLSKEGPSKDSVSEEDPKEEPNTKTDELQINTATVVKLVAAILEGKLVPVVCSNGINIISIISIIRLIKSIIHKNDPNDSKFRYAVLNVDPSTLTLVSDIISQPPKENKYETLKMRLIDALDGTIQSELRTLLHGHEFCGSDFNLAFAFVKL